MAPLEGPEYPQDHVLRLDAFALDTSLYTLRAWKYNPSCSEVWICLLGLLPAGCLSGPRLRR